ncbi:MAG: S8 family serine peptidase [Candidatus Zipacnadales bacterium]
MTKHRRRCIGRWMVLTARPHVVWARPRGRLEGSIGSLAITLFSTLLVTVGLAQPSPLPLRDGFGPPYRSVNSLGRPTIRPSQVIANRILIGLSKGANLADAYAIAAAMGGQVHRFLPRFDLLVLEFPLPRDFTQAERLATTFPRVRYAEPDVLIYPAVLPVDPRYADQWHHPVIHSPEAWDVKTGVSSTVIAVIDSGVDLDHPDLKSKIWTNPGEIEDNGKDDDQNGFIDDVHGWDFVDNNNEPTPSPDGTQEDANGEADDQVTHGTLVAGLAAAASNNFGTVGVDWKAKILPLQVFPDDGGTPTDVVIAALDYAIAIGVDVINLSLGAASFVTAFDDPIAAAYQAGITVVVAAGNGSVEFTKDRSTWTSPACNDGPNVGVDNYVLGVGATGPNDHYASFSNFDSSGYHFVDVSAPGVEIFGPGYQNDSFPAFVPPFAKGTGTSFSAPLVAGLAGLVKAQYPGLKHAQIIEHIRETADNIDYANPGFVGKLGMGRINAARALGVDLPPAPVRNLRAVDTPGDQGGSITLSWQVSPDDGFGANDVSEYVVFRAVSANGPFRVQQKLAAGTETYYDTSVENHVDYYYFVRTKDAGGQITDSDPAGPAAARDDTPPPAPMGLTAQDEPGDTGGAIRLTWEPYTPPPDFVEFRIYRSTSSFTTVSGMTPLATLSNASRTSYRDSTTLDGVDYWYAITAVDAEPNELTDVIAVGPAQSFPNQGIPIAAGLHFLATPIVPDHRDPARFFGIDPQDLMYARFDPTAGGGLGRYLFYEMAPQDPLLLLGLGRGFWFQAPRDMVVEPVGKVAPSGPFTLELEPGWRQIGNPFLSPTDFTRATVDYNGLTMDLQSADTQGILRRYAWVYNATTHDYDVIDPALATDRLIAPWEGFWVRVLKPCCLTLSRSSDAVTVARNAVSSSVISPAWYIQVIARTARSVDVTNYFGVATMPARFDIEAPPDFAEGVQLHFRDSRNAQRNYAALFKRPSGSRTTWTFKVRSDIAGDVIISTPDLSAVPREYALTLTDIESGRSVQLRTTSSYRYVSARPGAERHFEVTVQPAAASLMISALSARPMRHGGAEVRFVLSSEAACDIDVINLAGRPVRRLVGSRLFPTGQQVILWDGRNDTGVAVPNGRYLIRVTARSTTGQVAEGLSAVSIVR